MRRIGYALAALLFASPAYAAFDQGDLICETTTTTGTGTVSLGGALTNYVTFVSQIASGDTTTYTIEASDGTLETGTGVFTDGAPDTLTRVATWSTDGVGAELTLPAGTHTVCQSFNTSFFFDGISALELATLTLVGNLTFDADATSDIGTSTVGINDLHIGSGGIINWDGGDITWTHSANLITWAGGNLSVALGEEVIIGGATVLDLGDQNPALQVQGTSTSSASIGIAYFAADALGPRLSLNKSRDAAGTFTTILSVDDALGLVLFGGTEESGSFDDAASIVGLVDAEWGTAGDTSDNPGRLEFRTNADGTSTPTTRVTIKADGGVIIGNGTTSPGAEDLSLEGGDIEFGNAGTAGTDTTLSYAAAGNLTLEGSRIEKAGTQMIYVPAAAMISRATSGADCSATLDSGAADLTMRVCNFDTAADEWAHFTISMPPRWNEGTVTAEYVWSTTGASTPGETVSIDLSCVAISNDDPLNATLGTPVNVDDTMLSADGDSHLSPASGAVTCGGTPAANDTVVFAVMRDISDDNVAADMSLIGVRLFITTDTANDG
jgi:hypothetical protein